MKDVKFGYMCKTEFDWEVGEALGASRVYSTVEELKEKRKCTQNCGIVKVSISVVEVIQSENREWEKE